MAKLTNLVLVCTKLFIHFRLNSRFNYTIIQKIVCFIIIIIYRHTSFLQNCYPNSFFWCTYFFFKFLSILVFIINFVILKYIFID